LTTHEGLGYERPTFTHGEDAGVIRPSDDADAPRELRSVGPNVLGDAVRKLRPETKESE
jgi:hypothetical protein